MRLTRRMSVAVVGVATILAATACSSDGGGGTTAPDGSRGVHLVGRRWREGRPGRPGRSVRLRLRRLQLRQRRGRRRCRLPTPSRCWPRGCSPADPPDTFQAHAGAELNDYIDGRSDRGPQRAVPGVGPDQRLPPGPDRQPDGRRQDLLGAGEHPPRQRALEQQDRPGQRGYHQGRDDARRVLRRPGQAEGQGCHPARARARTGPSSCCSSPC